MTTRELFEKYEYEYGNFHLIENPPSNRPDLCAFILLDKLFPRSGDMVCSAEDDEICIDVDEEEVEELSDETVLYLTRCGIYYDPEYGCLYANV
jgi:hypothetical protein